MSTQSQNRARRKPWRKVQDEAEQSRGSQKVLAGDVVCRQKVSTDLQKLLGWARKRKEQMSIRRRRDRRLTAGDWNSFSFEVRLPQFPCLGEKELGQTLALFISSLYIGVIFFIFVSNI